MDGVGGVDINGGRYRQINVFLDLDKLNAYNLSAQDVEQAVQTENVETPGGRIVRGPTEIGVRTLGRVEHVEEFNNIIVKNVGGAPDPHPRRRPRRRRHGGEAHVRLLQLASPPSCSTSAARPERTRSRWWIDIQAKLDDHQQDAARPA